MSPAWFYRMAVLIAAGAVGGGVLATGRWDGFLVGDCPYYAAAAESLVRDGDFLLGNQLAPGVAGPDRLEALRPHSCFFALAPDGRAVPKHSTLLPIVSAPFLAVAGPAGLLVVNVLQVVVLLRGIVALAGDTPAARLVGFVGYVTTPFLAYTFNYSPDVFGTALAVWAYVAAARGRWAACGLLAGLAVWAKVYLAVVLLPAGLLVLPAGWRATLTALVAAAVAVAPMFVLNHTLYGGPLTTGYDREARVTDAGFAVAGHYSRFGQPVGDGLLNLLFSAKVGMAVYAPLWLLWPVGAWLALRRPESAVPRRLAVALAMAVVINVLFFARYDEWDASVLGNRFLFPALAFGLVLLEPLGRAALTWRKPNV